MQDLARRTMKPDDAVALEQFTDTDAPLQGKPVHRNPVLYNASSNALPEGVKVIINCSFDSFLILEGLCLQYINDLFFPSI